MKDESGDERGGGGEGVIVPSAMRIDLFMFSRGEHFVGHSPGRSAELVAALHTGSVGAEAWAEDGFDVSSLCVSME